MKCTECGKDKEIKEISFSDLIKGILSSMLLGFIIAVTLFVLITDCLV